ncbi:MAG TPA: phosphopantetheine-binding protein, partial [Longimicrobiaceae bacterium]|nr:phosphopantetheine-binding protein [Longimicrobiaceae bacterium]
VQVVAADPADEASMRAALAEAASRFGALHGVVLAADTPEAAVAGALALEGASEGVPLELLLVCSPAGDAAGTAFLEAFAAARSWGEGRPTVSVTWETPAGAGAESPFAGIAPAEGAELLGRLFARGTGPGVTVRVGDAAAAPALHARPAGTPYVEPRTGLERTIAEMFGGALGMERIGAEDGFFELGGDSLLATQLLSGINERFRVELPLRTLFEASTPVRLALEIVQKQAEQVDEDLLARALAEL